eukprot:CAMPEP_0175857868 /NCGR_PEP_ID=MMETSP0107_2-20121207/29333_1 /TAXON_ID=195067 ORGANISM="Goniomonas pacifica, Strain CCMP1869" /NCGR_SAMPLE_ID=MMETSP0107_2 /ASSEMBLY_ACC=CAM_ASM_000203 /LENGTH=43 /DNA_ID= /DNA_START= /DNA_END= /DNA_ORIENTATION=
MKTQAVTDARLTSPDLILTTPHQPTSSDLAGWFGNGRQGRMPL